MTVDDQNIECDTPYKALEHKVKTTWEDYATDRKLNASMILKTTQVLWIELVYVT